VPRRRTAPARTPLPEEEAVGHQTVEVRVPLSLASERLDRHHHARHPFLATEYGAEAATDGLERASG